MSIVISNLEIRSGRLSFRLEGGPVDRLWFEVVPEYEKWLTPDRYDAAVVALLPYAMKTGKTIKAAGGLTGILVHNLRTGIMPILKYQAPSLHLRNIEIEADLLDAPQRLESAVITGLSCGIDSLSTIRTQSNHAVEKLRITHLSFHDVGSHGQVDPEGVFATRLALVRGAAAELGLPLLVVRTNIAPFQVTKYRQHHTLWNSAVAIALGSGVGTYLFSSSVPYTSIFVGPSKAISWADPIVLPLLSGSGVDCISANAQMTRVEKTALIADWSFARRWLDVCVRPSQINTNCSQCWKCCRTMLTLELLGKLDGFCDRFDLERYRKVRHHYISYLLNNSSHPIEAEVLELARQQHVVLASLPRQLEALGQRLIASTSSVLPASIRWRLERLGHGF